MRILANKDNKRLFFGEAVLWLVFSVILQIIVWITCQRLSALLLVLSLLGGCSALAALFLYLYKQDKRMEEAVKQMELFLSGDQDARIDCNEEGELYTLFHGINNPAATLNAQAAHGNQEKEFLKNTISDISHQIKTPLAALNIYNGILQEETRQNAEMQEFVSLSEKELDRIETLVQNLLKITRLDAGTIVIEKSSENLADIMKDIELHFAYRAGQEGKQLILSGPEDVTLFCDRDWIIEAIENLVKNALDHTKDGDRIYMEWKKPTASVLQIRIKDTGCGIHPEDLYHIFKRFYRSRYSQDKQGLGLGLPLTKAIVEAHGGTIEVDSMPGEGSSFAMNFLI
ncbi:MAG: sensor histidine kinase [Lachnospiraceae bacterium]